MRERFMEPHPSKTDRIETVTWHCSNSGAVSVLGL